MGEQGEVMQEPIKLEEWHEPVAYVEVERFDNLKRRVEWLEQQLEKARRYIPAESERRQATVQFWYEIGGCAVAATGAWWVYPPAALLLVGGLMLGEVIVTRRQKRG